MDPLPYDLVIVRGITSLPIEIVFRNAAGDQIDLAGWTPFAQARKKPKRDVIVDLAPTIMEVGELLGYTGEEDGPGRVKLGGYTDEETLAMSDVDAFWDLVLQNPAGERLGPFVAGKFTVKTIITEPV